MTLDSFTPHGFCLAWQPGLVWLQALSDLLIAVAYFTIPAALIVFLRRRTDFVFRPIFACFAAFILLCGATHVLGVLTLWVPAYWLEGGIKALTAAVSLATAALLWRLLPQALALPSPAQLRAANQALADGIAERDAATARLRRSEDRLRRFYARTPAPLHATDAEGRIVDVSDQWLDLVGTTRAAVIGRPVQTFYVPEDRPQVDATLADLLRGQPPPARAERRLLRTDGTVRQAEAVFAIERGEGGDLRHVLVALTDITARREAEAALAASEALLRQAQKMEAVGQLTGGLAHDFNNLLQAILGALELLRGDESLNARAQRRVELALAAGTRGARLVGQLLTFSRTQNLVSRPIAPAAILDGFEDLLVRTAGPRAALHVSPADGTWPMLADRNQLEAALLNLVINARDAIDTEGEIAIRFGNRTLDAAQARAADPALTAGDYVAITVADTGHGMTPAVRARAFEPFFTTKPTGTGLGLAQCYGFARQSGGALLLDSAPGEGTRVTILLPRADPAAAAPARAEAPPAAGRGETILLAEDDPLLRTTVGETLAGHGFIVIAAEDGPAALRAFDIHPEIALLFTDVVMPGAMDGVALALALRGRRPALPVLFSSGHADGTTLERWPEPIDMLAKPYAAADLLARIRTALDAAITSETAV